MCIVFFFLMISQKEPLREYYHAAGIAMMCACWQLYDTDCLLIFYFTVDLFLSAAAKPKAYVGIISTITFSLICWLWFRFGLIMVRHYSQNENNNQSFNFWVDYKETE